MANITDVLKETTIKRSEIGMYGPGDVYFLKGIREVNYGGKAGIKNQPVEEISSDETHLRNLSSDMENKEIYKFIVTGTISRPQVPRYAERII